MESKSYEELYNRLNEIVNELQKEDINIDNSIALFKEGIQIQKTCQLILKDAESKVINILNDNNELEVFEEGIK